MRRLDSEELLTRLGTKAGIGRGNDGISESDVSCANDLLNDTGQVVLFGLGPTEPGGEVTELSVVTTNWS